MKYLLAIFLITSTYAADTFLYDNINMKTKYKDTSGNLWDTAVLFTSDGAGKAVPAFQQDLVGNVNGYYPTKARGFVVGRRGNVDNVRADMWEGPTAQYVFPTVAQQMRIVSTSASDSAAGTGARRVVLRYLDASFTEQTETITLNGLTPVLTTATNIYRINRIYSTEVGSTGAAVGTLSLTNTAATVTYAVVSATYNMSVQLIYTVPVGKTAYISHVQVGAGANTAGHFTQFELVATAFGLTITPGIFLIQDIIAAQDSGQAINYPIPLPFTAGTDIKIRAFSDAAAANVFINGAIMGWVE